MTVRDSHRALVSMATVAFRHVYGRSPTLPELVRATHLPVKKVRDITGRTSRAQELRVMSYREYLLTPEWLRRREEALDRAGHRCQVCNRGYGELNVHHRTYERRGFEDPGDLIVLCRPCHAHFHGRARRKAAHA